jgi:hypothetical protein
MDALITVGKVRATDAGRRLGAPACISLMFSDKDILRVAKYERCTCAALMLHDFES